MKTMVKYKIATGIGGSTGAFFQIPNHNAKYIWLNYNENVQGFFRKIINFFFF